MFKIQQNIMLRALELENLLLCKILPKPFPMTKKKKKCNLGPSKGVRVFGGIKWKQI